MQPGKARVTHFMEFSSYMEFLALSIQTFEGPRFWTTPWWTKKSDKMGISWMEGVRR